MKGKGKWALLLLALGFMYAGCLGSSGSSDESAVAAKDNPILGTWKVTVAPNEGVALEPLTLGGASILPSYLDNGVMITDQVIQASFSGPITFTTDTVALANGHINPGSERVLNAACSAGGTGVCKRGVDYTIAYYDPLAPSTGVGSITRMGAIPVGGTVTLSYGYGNGTCPAYNMSPEAGTNRVIDCIEVENHTYNYIEKLRSWTGEVAGLGAANNPLLGDGTTLMGSDYPLSGSTYAIPNSAMTSLVEGWAGGICYNAWGDWSTITNPKVEGCSIAGHPNNPATQRYVPAWLDPVCGKSQNAVTAPDYHEWSFTGSFEKYSFYAQLTGDLIPWDPDYLKGLGDQHPGRDRMYYSTWHAVMAYLTPDFSDLPVGNYCNTGTIPANTKYWWKGSMTPITPGNPTRHCGTLIKDPHLRRSTYFAVNLGVEFSDTIENNNKKFWDAYVAQGADKNATVTGAPQGMYPLTVALTLIYDFNKLNLNTSAVALTRPIASGGTLFPGGTAPATNFVSNTYTMNQAVGPNRDSKARWSHGMDSVTQDKGYIVVTQTFQTTASLTTFQFFSTYFGGSPTTLTAPYITQAITCVPGKGLPKWAGHWGVTHYDSSCNLVTEGADNDLDFWGGMVVLKVRPTTAVPGDYLFLRFEQSTGNSLFWVANNSTAKRAGYSDDDFEAMNTCLNKVTGLGACPPAPTLDDIIWKCNEQADPAVPPGQASSCSVRPSGCPYGTGVKTCGGQQTVGGVVCVQ